MHADVLDQDLLYGTRCGLIPDLVAELRRAAPGVLDGRARLVRCLFDTKTVFAGNTLYVQAGRGVEREAAVELEEHRVKYEANMKEVVEGLTRMGVQPHEYAPPQGAFYIYVNLKGHGVTDSLGMCNALLEEAGVLPEAQWIAAVGADAASMGRSIPLDKAMDDSLLALFATGLASGQAMMPTAALACCMAALAVETMGNTPISAAALRSSLQEVLLP